MKVEIKIPSVGESVTEATIAQILKASGSPVEKEDEIIELETDKVNQVVYAPVAGVVTINVKEGDSVQVGQVVGTIDSDAKAEASATEQKETTPSPQEEAPKEEKKPEKKEEAPAKEAAPSKEAPAHQARMREDEFIASLSNPKEVKESPAKDEPAKKEAVKTTDGGAKRVRMSGLRKTIAKRLVEVKNQTAMLTTFNEVDMSEVMAIRKREKENFEKKHGVKLGFMSFFVKACVAALNEIPEVNAFIDGDEIVYNEPKNIGISVSTDRGLMVPVIRDCQEHRFAEIEKAIVEFAKKARSGSISIDDLQGGTFTITNGGVFGSMLSTPILNPPQSAILGMHNIVERPMAIDGKVVIRPMMYLALSYDHRIIDGKEAVTFLVHVKKHLEDPARLLLDF